jgi:hypothetical protein
LFLHNFGEMLVFLLNDNLAQSSALQITKFERKLGELRADLLLLGDGSSRH